ncbi:MAG: hypothetical protein K9M07_04450 [Simkaniaceae bacterium]|nr:hypothetical protein [Simkaniaceae bacterium]
MAISFYSQIQTSITAFFSTMINSLSDRVTALWYQSSVEEACVFRENKGFWGNRVSSPQEVIALEVIFSRCMPKAGEEEKSISIRQTGEDSPLIRFSLSCDEDNDAVKKGFRDQWPEELSLPIGKTCSVDIATCQKDKIVSEAFKIEIANIMGIWKEVQVGRMDKKGEEAVTIDALKKHGLFRIIREATANDVSRKPSLSRELMKAVLKDYWGKRGGLSEEWIEDVVNYALKKRGYGKESIESGKNKSEFPLPNGWTGVFLHMSCGLICIFPALMGAIQLWGHSEENSEPFFLNREITYVNGSCLQPTI